MFIRFVSSYDHPTLDAELGMFAARDEIDFSQLKGRVQQAHDEAWYWFSSNGGGGLLYPKLKGKARTSKVRKSLFWFYEHASFNFERKGTVIRRARELAAAISDCGVEIRELRTDDPGEIIWKDAKQVLAFPGDKKTPRAF